MKLNKQPLGLPAYRPALEQQPGVQYQSVANTEECTFSQPTTSRLNRQQYDPSAQSTRLLYRGAALKRIRG
ncbi:hypothetical protein WJX79_000476 [Trebouxia sp. C0005]